MGFSTTTEQTAANLKTTIEIAAERLSAQQIANFTKHVQIEGRMTELEDKCWALESLVNRYQNEIRDLERRLEGKIMKAEVRIVSHYSDCGD